MLLGLQGLDDHLEPLNYSLNVSGLVCTRQLKELGTSTGSSFEVEKILPATG